MNTIDFLPKSYHEARIQQEVKRRRWVLIMLSAIVLIGWGLTRHQGSARLADKAQDLEVQVHAAHLKSSEMDKLRLERKNLTYQKLIQQQLDLPISVTQTVAQLGELMPRATGLTGLEVTTHRPPPKPLEDETESKKKRSAKRKTKTVKTVPPDYMELELKGVAPDDIVVSSLAEALSDHPLFERVKMNFSRSAEQAGLVTRRFSIGAEVPLARKYEPLPSTAEVTDED